LTAAGTPVERDAIGFVAAVAAPTSTEQQGYIPRLFMFRRALPLITCEHVALSLRQSDLAVTEVALQRPATEAELASGATTPRG
ncbi:hypothetical protein, partial [Salmonella enterica]|uniref:hypothetical protein n=1 Tax=Salmonella enterica TaxID=28901 RepID=UPI0032994A66